LEVEDFAAGFSEDQAEIPIAGFILGEGKFHLITVAIRIFARNDGCDRNIERGKDLLDFSLFLDKLFGIRDLLRSTAPAIGDVDAKRVHGGKWYQFPLETESLSFDFAGFDRFLAEDFSDFRKV
jgi:hypothetical protein